VDITGRSELEGPPLVPEILGDLLIEFPHSGLGLFMECIPGLVGIPRIDSGDLAFELGFGLNAQTSV
jgi:hypothetical protein